MLKKSKIILIAFLTLSSFYSSASLLRISVEFEATEFEDLFGSQQFPVQSIGGTTSFLIDTGNNISGVYIGETLPSLLNLEIDGKTWSPAETLISYIFQGNVLTHFTLGGVISPSDSPFSITGTNNDFTIDRQGNVPGGATVALQSLGTIFNSQTLTLDIAVTKVPTPPALYLMGLGIFALFYSRSNVRKLAD